MSNKENQKEEKKWVNSCKFSNDSNFYLTYEQDVDSYNLDDIIEIEYDYLETKDKRNISDFHQVGLISTVIVSIILGFFNFFPEKNYFEEVWIFFPIKLILIHLVLYILLTEIFTFLLEDKIIGRNLFIYHKTKGKTKYYISELNYKEVLSSDFFAVLFEKCTRLRTNIQDIKDGQYYSPEIESEKKSQKEAFESRKLDNIKFLLLSLILIAFYSIWYSINLQKKELITVIISCLIMLLFEILDLIDNHRKIKFWIGRKEKYYSFIVHTASDRPEKRLTKTAIKNLSLDEVEITTWMSYTLRVEISETENFHIPISQDRYYQFDALLTAYGISYYLNRIKTNELMISIYEYE